jgi:cytochrome bd-type quinol oxidase subunit 2
MDRHCPASWAFWHGDDGRGLRSGREVSTLLWSKLGILGVISSVGLTMFPFILPSSLTRMHR